MPFGCRSVVLTVLLLHFRCRLFYLTGRLLSITDRLLSTIDRLLSTADRLLAPTGLLDALIVPFSGL
jgi:hypothetical protein